MLPAEVSGGGALDSLICLRDGVTGNTRDFEDYVVIVQGLLGLSCGVLGITQNPPRRLAQGGMPHMRPAAGVDKLLHLRRGPHRGALHKNFQASSDVEAVAKFSPEAALALGEAAGEGGSDSIGRWMSLVAYETGGFGGVRTVLG